jgi:hypothetical protein
VRAHGIIRNAEDQIGGWDGHSCPEMMVGDTCFLNQIPLTAGLNYAIIALTSGLNYTTTILTSRINPTIPWIRIT